MLTLNQNGEAVKKNQYSLSITIITESSDNSMVSITRIRKYPLEKNDNKKEQQMKKKYFE